MELLSHFLPRQASTIAGHVDALYLFLIAISVFFSGLIAFLVIFFALKYKRKSHDETPAGIHGNLWLELIWTGIPLVIVLIIFVWGAALFVRHFQIPPDAKEIFVVGKQWMWKIQHPEGPREINELHVPIGKPIKLTMTSEDVIHSFYVPAFRLKMDVLPGKYTHAWFEATETGEFHLFCAEYCGTEHSLMIGKIVVMEEESYNKWLAEQTSPDGQTVGLGLQVRGEALFRELRCLTCHHSEGGALGANLNDLYGREVTLTSGEKIIADENYIRQSILEPSKKIVAGYGNLMPTYKNKISEEDLLAVLEYIKSMKTDEVEEVRS